MKEEKQSMVNILVTYIEF